MNLTASIWLLLATMSCVLGGIVLHLYPLLAIALVLLVLAGMAAWREIRPYQQSG